MAIKQLKKLSIGQKALFKEPIYAIIGGLHFPVTDSRLVMYGIKIQKYVGIGRYPWEPFTMNDVKKSIEYIKKVNPKIVAISAHDSCDASIGAFKDGFRKQFRDIVVGIPSSLVPDNYLKIIYNFSNQQRKE